VDEQYFQEFQENLSKYNHLKWIFYGSKDFIYSIISKDSYKSNLWAVIVENKKSPQWSLFIDKLLNDQKEVLIKDIHIDQHPPQKDLALKEVETILDTYDLSSRVKNHILFITDELLMNALYDAPFSEEKGYLYEQTPRNAPLKMEKPVELSVSSVEGYLKIRVTDFYGSLSKSKIMYHLTRRFDDTKYQINQEKAGAGLGIAQSFQKGANLHFECVEKKHTTVEASFKIVGSYLEHLEEHKFVVFNFEGAYEKKAVNFGR
jgi:hypothetical protein